MRNLSTTLALLMLLITFSYFEATMAGPVPDGLPGFCSSKCVERCKKAAVKDRCVKYCGICCLQCKCVPSGTYGNKNECPCYRDKLNKKGKSKCP